MEHFDLLLYASFENEAKFKYFEIIVTNQNCIYKATFWNKRYHLVRYLCLLICCLIMKILNYTQNCNFFCSFVWTWHSHPHTERRCRLKKFNDRVLMRTISCNKVGSVIVAQNGCQNICCQDKSDVSLNFRTSRWTISEEVGWLI